MNVFTLFTTVAIATCGAFAVEPPSSLRVSNNGRFLVNESGAPVFLLCDTAWSLVNRLRREEITSYLEHRRAQGFNAVTFVLYSTGDPNQADSGKNIYGHAPFELTDGRPDPTRPLVTPDQNYWDHVAFAVAETKRLGFYAVILPCWGSAVVGGYRGEPTRDIIFNTANARVYGRWLGARFKDEPHILWMLGGDRQAVYGERDFRPVFRALAEGLTEGGARQMKSFHPPKRSLQSGDWFHTDAWLTFNSIQHWPEDQIAAITRDWQRQPPKPTWVFEPRYEGYWKKPYTAANWGEWQTRQQAYQSVFAGGFGFTYGHERIFCFGKDGWDWRKELDAPGASQLRHLVALMSRWSRADYLSRVPDQSLLAGDEGKAERLTSDRLTATRNGDATLAMIYSANGRAVRVRMEKLRGTAMNASWFDPRTGKTTVIGEFPNNGEREFTPPTSGETNDWVLVLDAATTALNELQQKP